MTNKTVKTSPSCHLVNVEYQTIGHLFGVSRVTVCMVLKDVCRAIQSRLLHVHIKFPKVDDLNVIYAFEREWGCAGAI